MGHYCWHTMKSFTVVTFLLVLICAIGKAELSPSGFFDFLLAGSADQSPEQDPRAARVPRDTKAANSEAKSFHNLPKKAEEKIKELSKPKRRDSEHRRSNEIFAAFNGNLIVHRVLTI